MNEHKESYKKSYKGLAACLLGFMFLTLSSSFLPIQSKQVLMLTINNLTTTEIFLLSFIIYKTESVYWYNGTSYQDALNAGSKRRKAFAIQHMKRFGFFALSYLVYSIFSFLLSFPYQLDFVIVFFGIIITVLSTIKLSL